MVLGVQGEEATPTPTPEGVGSGRQLFAGFKGKTLVAGGFVVGGVLLLGLSVLAKGIKAKITRATVAKISAKIKIPN